MSISDSRVKGKLDEVAGKIKRGVGDMTGDASLANKGTAQEVKGNAEQAWGSVKEAAHDTHPRDTTAASSTGSGSAGHDIRQKITSTAANVKDHITHAADRHKNS